MGFLCVPILCVPILCVPGAGPRGAQSLDDWLQWSTAMRLSQIYAVALLLTAAVTAQERTLQQELDQFVRPFVKNWCGECHSADEPEADLDLQKAFLRLPTGDDLVHALDLRDVLEEEEMPPEDEPQPPEKDIERIIAWSLRMLAASEGEADPGRVTMRRLSLVEYKNTIRDLLGVTEDVTRGFPRDDLGYGFDNIGEALSVSALHLEKYAAAAGRIAELAIITEDLDNPPVKTFELEDYITSSRAVRQSGDYAAFTSRGLVEFPFTARRDGLYRVRVTAYGQQAGDEPARLGLTVAGSVATRIDVPNERSKPGVFQRELRLKAGARRLGVTFVNDYYNPKHKDKRKRDRNLFVDYIEVIGPVDDPVLPPSHVWIFERDKGRGRVVTRARPILTEVMRYAWRRPVTRAEVTRMCRVVKAAVDDGDRFEQGIQVAVQAVLVSPHFLFRIEPGGKGESKSDSQLLGGYELASRLSYFLWSSMPDERLMDLAKAGRLTEPRILHNEVQRMLLDERADALAENFAAQWLELRALDEVAPDPDRFPAYSSGLRRAMRRETELFFRAVLREKRPIRELVTADFTFLNEVLATHYGIDGVQGTSMRRVTVSPAKRGGLATHASILTVTSNPTRTSPVKRGKWLLENLLDDPPPAPPPGFDSFEEGADVDAAATLREQMAMHREDPACIICHQRMDMLGLALENYDAIGAWRDEDGGTPIDASGKLPNGKLLNGPGSLKEVLVEGDAFLRCLAKKLFLYAIGREVRGADEVVLDSMVRSLPKNPSLADLIGGIVSLDAFRMRRVVR